MRTVLATPFTPRAGTGRTRRTLSVIRALARLGEVDVVYAPFDGDEPAAEIAALDGVRLRALPQPRDARRAAAYALARLRGAPDDFARGVTPRLLTEARRLSGGGARLVVDGFPAAVTALAVGGRDRPTYCAHNLESGFRHVSPAFERRVLRRMAQTWMVSRAEVEQARALAPGADVRHVPNAVDVAAIAAVAPPGERRILFAADYAYPPNQDALGFLVDDVLPRLRERAPGARLVLAGRGLPERTWPADVEPLGFVDDLEAVYARADAVAVPLRVGGGSPLKLVEALAHALPVVATARAAAAVDARDGEHLLVADDAGDFAAALATAARGEAAGIGAAGRAMAERELSLEALTERLRAC